MWGKKVDTMIRTVDQDELAAIVREAGYKALVKSTEEGGSQYQGDAYIETAQNGWQTFITFYNKTEDGKYTSVQFGLRLNDNEGTFGGTARMNEFNSRWRFVKGVINADNSFRIQMDVDLDGGVHGNTSSSAWVSGTISWARSITSRRKFIESERRPKPR